MVQGLGLGSSLMSRYQRRQLTFWSVHLALLGGVLVWALAFEPSLVNLAAVGICLVLPSVTATALYRQLILGRLWLTLWRPAAAAAALERFLEVLRRRPWLSDLRALTIPSRFGGLEAQARVLLGQAHLALGQRESARDWMKSALRREPGSTEIRELIEQVSRVGHSGTSRRGVLLSALRDRESVPPSRVSLLSEPPSH